MGDSCSKNCTRCRSVLGTVAAEMVVINKVREETSIVWAWSSYLSKWVLVASCVMWRYMNCGALRSVLSWGEDGSCHISRLDSCRPDLSLNCLKMIKDYTRSLPRRSNLLLTCEVSTTSCKFRICSTSTPQTVKKNDPDQKLLSHKTDGHCQKFGLFKRRLLADTSASPLQRSGEW